MCFRQNVCMNELDTSSEAVFYNALNAAQPGYKTLRKQYARHGSWEKCWRWHGSGKDPEREAAALRGGGIGLVLNGEPGYPPLLAEIPNPPLGIYYKGALAAAGSTPAVAVVGTRKASAAGIDLAREFGSALAAAGCAVVSGMALGIDAAAHAGTLEARGRTIAVLANGLDQPYPSSHGRLAGNIIESGGTMISEYPPGTPPFQKNFLQRNRLISGLAQAVVAIEVPERSGVLATARFAVEQNRDLFVVPGPVSHPNYEGSHRLIRSGAMLAAGPRDVLADLGFDPLPNPRPVIAATPAEESVLGVMRATGRPLAIDEIIEAATLTSSMVNQTLTMLILKDAVREEGGRYALR